MVHGLGHRRSNDLQHEIEHHRWIGTVECFCLSIDLCLQGPAGDLLARERIEWWKARILSGQVCGIGGAPLRNLVSGAVDGGGAPPSARQAHSMGLTMDFEEATRSGNSRHRTVAGRYRVAATMHLRRWVRIP